MNRYGIKPISFFVKVFPADEKSLSEGMKLMELLNKYKPI